MRLTDLCTPALIYFLIAVVVLTSALLMGIVSIPLLLVKVLFVVIWTWFLNFLCSNNYTGVSWFLVIIPYLFMIFLVGVIYESQQHIADKLMLDLGKQ